MYRLMCAGLLVITGVLDDRFDISAVARAIIQALVAMEMMVFSGRYINKSRLHFLATGDGTRTFRLYW